MANFSKGVKDFFRGIDWKGFFLVSEAFVRWLKLFQGARLFLADCDFILLGEGEDTSKRAI